MKKYLVLIVFMLLFTASYAQVVKQGQKFEDVAVVNGKVVFLKEIPLKKNFSKDFNFKLLKDWARKNYGKDPFISSVRYDEKNYEIIAKSRIELLLPANSKGVREKMTMRYRVNGFLFQDKCVLEITDISYMYQNTSGEDKLPRVIRAEEFITNTIIDANGDFQELKLNTRKSTLFFINELANEFTEVFAD
jgi:hypothetical protein